MLLDTTDNALRRQTRLCARFVL